MTARVVTGHDLQKRILTRVSDAVKESGVAPTVALVRVEGDDPMTPINFRLHQRVFGDVGFQVRPYELERDTDWPTLNKLIQELNADEEVDIILVLIPLPDHLDIREVLAAIDPAKEAEGLHLDHVIRLNPLSALPATRIPVVPLSVVHLLTEIDYDPAGEQVVVLIDPVLTATNPVAKMVAKVAAFSALPDDAAGCAVPLNHPRAKEIAAQADLLIVTVQEPECVDADWVKPGALVLDFNPIPTGFRPSRKNPERQVPQLVGGLVRESVEKVAGTVVPAPGGIGPVMIATLAEQIVAATAQRRALPGGDAPVDGLEELVS